MAAWRGAHTSVVLNSRITPARRAGVSLWVCAGFVPLPLRASGKNSFLAQPAANENPPPVPLMLMIDVFAASPDPHPPRCREVRAARTHRVSPRHALVLRTRAGVCNSTTPRSRLASILYVQRDDSLRRWIRMRGLVGIHSADEGRMAAEFRRV